MNYDALHKKLIIVRFKSIIARNLNILNCPVHDHYCRELLFGMHSKDECNYLRNINLFIDFIRLSKIEKVVACSLMFFKAYSDNRKNKNNDEIEWNYKSCEKVFIHCSNYRIFVKVNNLENNHFCQRHHEIHVCSVKSKKYCKVHDFTWNMNKKIWHVGNKLLQPSI